MDIYKKQTLPLLPEEKPFFYYKSQLESLKEEIEEFLKGPGKSMNNRQIAEKYCGCSEIQANNSIEGYNDDAKVITSVLAEGYSLRMPKKRLKIIRNLHQGYQMILSGEEITKAGLKKLYSILSDELLTEDEIATMGPYYRNDEVKIFCHRDLSRPPESGIETTKVEEYMDSLFEFLSTQNNLSTLTDHYIKSQIIHFYFVYVHPYFDVNGRTARTLSMWYLINNESYPFIIFNRAIPFDRTKYIKTISDTKKFRNITGFLNFMLTHVKVELEKEYIISSIADTLDEPLTDEEHQTIRYILSMRGEKTVKDFTSFYNRFNEKSHFRALEETAIHPLVEKDVLRVVRHTGKSLENYVFELNEKRFDSDPSKIKRLTL